MMMWRNWIAHYLNIDVDTVEVSGSSPLVILKVVTVLMALLYDPLG